jgi:hypothetical protein
LPGRQIGETGGDPGALEADGSPMALRRALEMLQAGERINDQLYPSTIGRSRGPGRLWVYQPGHAAISLIDGQPRRGSALRIGRRMVYGTV